MCKAIVTGVGRGFDMSLTLARTADRNVVVDRNQRELASELHTALFGHPERLLVAEPEQSRPLPPALANVIAQVVEAMASGGTVTIGSLPDELSTTVAAKQLGISRPTLMKMIRNGEIPAHKVGSHHRLKSADVLAFKRERLAAQRRALADLNELLDEDEHN
jgi:excisionase family DNA binding protein